MKKANLGIWLAALAGLASPTYGSLERFRAPADLMKQSALVFEGEVTNITYRTSAPDNAAPKGQPFTYVEYRVLTPIRGNPGKTFTLRFWGGLRTDDSYMVAGNTPQFDVGDRDVLFVKRNTLLACPLAECEAGRFRIVSDRVYLDSGRTLRLRNGKTALAGAPQRLREFVTQTITSPQSGKSVEVQRDGSVTSAPTAEPDQFRGGAFVAYLKRLAATVPAPSGVEVSANRSEIPKAYLLTPKTPKEPRPVNEPPGSPADQAELKAYEANSGNPVLPKKQ